MCKYLFIESMKISQHHLGWLQLVGRVNVHRGRPEDLLTGTPRRPPEPSQNTASRLRVPQRWRSSALTAWEATLSFKTLETQHVLVLGGITFLYEFALITALNKVGGEEVF